MKKLLLFGLMIVGMCAGRAEWTVEAGYWSRSGMEVRARGGSRAVDSGVRIGSPGIRDQVLFSDPAFDAPDLSVQELREFDDGFVGPSGLPFFFNAGETQFFGFQNDIQHDPAAGTLTFQSTRERASASEQLRTSLQTQGDGTWGDRGDLNGDGAYISLNRMLIHGEIVSVGARLRLGWMSGLDRTLGAEGLTSQSFAETRVRTDRMQRETRSFEYDTFGNPFFPSAPYAMEDPEGVGPLISDVPIHSVILNDLEEGTETRIGGTRRDAMARIRLETEADLFALGFGPRMRIGLTDSFALLLQGGVSVNLLDVHLRREEMLVTSSGQTVSAWLDESSPQKWLAGASLGLGAEFSFGDHLMLQATAGYEWIEKARFRIGPDEITYDLSGYQIDLALGWRFGSTGE